MELQIKELKRNNEKIRLDYKQKIEDLEVLSKE